MLSLGQLYTDDNTNDDDNDDDNTNDDDNDTWQTNHDCIGSLACMPNEPKTLAKLPVHTKDMCWLYGVATLREGERGGRNSLCSRNHGNKRTTIYWQFYLN